MNISCVICSELFDPASETHITPCGHMFHFACLMKWLERSKTCPQCRCKVTERSIFKVYFNLANTSVVDDVGTLQARFENLQFDLKLKEKDLKDRKEKCRNMKSVNAILKNEIIELENKIRVNESAMAALKDQIIHFKNKAKDVDKYKEEVFRLKSTMKEFENVQSVVRGTREEVNNLLMNEKDIDSLALLAVTLKKTLLETEKKKREMEHKLKQAQNQATSYRRSTLTYETENLELKKELDNLKANFAKEKEYLRSKLCEVQSKQPDLASTSLRRIAMESPVNFSQSTQNQKKLNSSDVICLDDTFSSAVTEKARKTNESESPYLSLKSGTLDYNSLLSRVNQKAAGASSGTSKSIFRTASSKSDDLQIPKTAGITYDGLGGLSKEDVFPSGRAAAKRPKASSAVSAKKFKRLAPPPNNPKISAFLNISDDIVLE